MIEKDIDFRGAKNVTSITIGNGTTLFTCVKTIDGNVYIMMKTIEKRNVGEVCPEFKADTIMEYAPEVVIECNSTDGIDVAIEHLYAARGYVATELRHKRINAIDEQLILWRERANWKRTPYSLISAFESSNNKASSLVILDIIEACTKYKQLKQDYFASKRRRDDIEIAKQIVEFLTDLKTRI